MAKATKTKTKAADPAEEGEAQQQLVLIHVPATVDQMLPPKAEGIITGATNLVRAHWEEFHALYASISGESPSEHGSIRLDEAALVFRAKELARQNGFSFLAAVPTETLRKALRRAYKRNNGIAMWQLEAQGKRLALEHRRNAAANA